MKIMTMKKLCTQMTMNKIEQTMDRFHQRGKMIYQQIAEHKETMNLMINLNIKMKTSK